MPPTRVTVHSVPDPEVRVTVPEGVPLNCGTTVTVKTAALSAP